MEFIDLGQSDCILIRGQQRNYLIDTGLPETSGRLLEYLNSQNIEKIEGIIITHYHDDHYGGLKDIITHKQVKRVIMPSHQPAFRDLEFLFLKQSNVSVEYISKTFKIDDSDLSLAPILPNMEDKDLENNNSIVFVGIIDGLKYGFMADVEKQRETELVKENILQNCDIMKVPHHGLNTSTTEELLRYINPRVIILTCDGKDSPDNDVYERLLKSGGALFRTDRHGTITVKGCKSNKAVEINTDKVIE